MDARYLQATTVLPHQNKVCGRTLRPFCLRHRVAMEAIQSPFLTPENGKFSPVDVVIASRILHTYDKQKMSHSMSFMDVLWAFWFSINNKAFSRSVGNIVGVMMVSCTYPKMWKKEDKGKQAENIPWILGCISNLVRNGVSYEDAWTMPEGEAVWMSIANAIYNGAKIDILSTEQEAELEKFNERVENYKKRMNHN